jgi:hypothetical protein
LNVQTVSCKSSLSVSIARSSLHTQEVLTETMSVLILVSCLQWFVFSTLLQNNPKFWSFDFDLNFGFGQSIIYTYDLRGSGKKHATESKCLHICSQPRFTNESRKRSILKKYKNVWKKFIIS